MSEQHPRGIGASSVDGFDVQAVAVAGSVPAVLDHLGRSHFTWSVCELCVAPAGRTALCNVALRGETGRMEYRQLEATTRGAALLAETMRAFALSFGDAEPRPAPTVDSATWRALVATFPFDDPARHEDGRQQLERRGTCAPKGPHVRDAIGDVLHPKALERQFSFAELHEEATAEGDVLAVLSPDGMIGFLRGHPGEEVDVFLVSDKEPRWGTRQSPAGVLLMITVQEGLSYAGISEHKWRDMLPSARVAGRKLVALRKELADGLDAIEGHRRLREVFDPDGRPGGQDGTSPGRMTALATVAMRKWAARRGTAPLELEIDRGRVIDAAGAEPQYLDGEYVLQLGGGELRFSIEGDLAVGRGSVICDEDRLASGPFAFSARTLECVVWALAGVDGLDRRPARVLRGFVASALATPWFDPRAETSAMLRQLRPFGSPRSRKDRAAAAAVRSFVDRAPRP
jgi:hypothetical protein